MSTNIFGNAPNQVPTNADLGGMAYQDPRFVVVAGGNVNPTNFGTSNAQILAGNLTGIFNLAATAGNVLTLVSDNLSTGNARFTGGSITGITGAATTLVADNFSAANINMTGTTITSGTVQITNATDSVGPNSGALRVSGGVGVLGNLHVAGNLFVTGNTLSLSTQDLRVSDSIIELHTFANLAPHTVNDGRDIGLKMHYFDTQDSHAFLGRDNATGYLEWLDRGIEGFGNVFQGNTFGTFKSGEYIAANNVPSTSTTTGAIRVTGGVGIGNGLYVNGTSWFQNASTANLLVTGGSLTGTTGAFTALVATNFSAGNTVLAGSSTLFTNNFSSPNVQITGGNINLGTANWLTTANLASGNVQITGGSITGITGAATRFVVTDFSSSNIYQTGTSQSIQTANAQIGSEWGVDSRANLLVGNVRTLHATAGNVTTLSAPNFSSANIFQTGTQSIQTGNAAIIGGNVGMDYNRTVTPIGNLYTTIGHAVNFSSGNVTVNGNITVGPAGTTGLGSAAPYGNLIITGNAYINNGAQDLSANAIAVRGYVDAIGIIFGV